MCSQCKNSTVCDLSGQSPEHCDHTFVTETPSRHYSCQAKNDMIVGFTGVQSLSIWQDMAHERVEMKAWTQKTGAPLSFACNLTRCDSGSATGKIVTTCQKTHCVL